MHAKGLSHHGTEGVPSLSCQKRWPSRVALLSISRLARGLAPAAAAQASNRARMEVTTGRMLGLTCNSEHLSVSTRQLQGQGTGWYPCAALTSTTILHITQACLSQVRSLSL